MGHYRRTVSQLAVVWVHDEPLVAHANLPVSSVISIRGLQRLYVSPAVACGSPREVEYKKVGSKGLETTFRLFVLT